MYTEVPDPEQMSDVLEQFHVQLQRFFGAAPTDRLRVKLFADRISLVAAMKADGLTVGKITWGALLSIKSHRLQLPISLANDHT